MKKGQTNVATKSAPAKRGRPAKAVSPAASKAKAVRKTSTARKSANGNAKARVQRKHEGPVARKPRAQGQGVRKARPTVRERQLEKKVEALYVQVGAAPVPDEPIEWSNRERLLVQGMAFLGIVVIFIMVFWG